jgi:hypothetical protein
VAIVINEENLTLLEDTLKELRNDNREHEQGCADIT